MMVTYVYIYVTVSYLLLCLLLPCMLFVSVIEIPFFDFNENIHSVKTNGDNLLFVLLCRKEMFEKMEIIGQVTVNRGTACLGGASPVKVLGRLALLASELYHHLFSEVSNNPFCHC